MVCKYPTPSGKSCRDKYLNKSCGKNQTRSLSTMLCENDDYEDNLPLNELKKLYKKKNQTKKIPLVEPVVVELPELKVKKRIAPMLVSGPALSPLPSFGAPPVEVPELKVKKRIAPMLVSGPALSPLPSFGAPDEPPKKSKNKTMKSTKSFKGADHEEAAIKRLEEKEITKEMIDAAENLKARKTTLRAFERIEARAMAQEKARRNKKYVSRGKRISNGKRFSRAKLVFRRK